MAAAAIARKAGSRQTAPADDNCAAGGLPECGASGFSTQAAAAVTTAAATISQIRSRATVTSSRTPAPKLPAMNAAEPHIRTGP